MKKVALSEIKDDLSRYLRLAEKEEVVITRHGKPAGVLIGFGSDGRPLLEQQLARCWGGAWAAKCSWLRSDSASDHFSVGARRVNSSNQFNTSRRLDGVSTSSQRMMNC